MLTLRLYLLLCTCGSRGWKSASSTQILPYLHLSPNMATEQCDTGMAYKRVSNRGQRAQFTFVPGPTVPTQTSMYFRACKLYS